ncbi:MAG: hypothetical protein JXA82_01160, partial [Sedimentisphaerales bacterium]|nr:hypothetical protein [Sedimentisphaerales bacterium]
FLQSASGIIQINEIINNSALGSGGGIFCADSDQLLLFSNLIAGNSANSNGGGILNRKNGQMILTNCTIGNNTATNGGGIYNSATDLTINNSILWGNTDTQNKQILDAFASPSSIEVSFSDVQGGFSGNNIDADPLFTDPNNNDYRVSSESPCIDAGDNTAVLPDFLLDLDGKNRIVNGDCQNQDSVDMGAYEFDWTAFGDFAGGCNVNLEDFMLFASVWLSKEGDLYYNPLYDIYNPNDHVINGFDLGILIDNWLEGN